MTIEAFRARIALAKDMVWLGALIAGFSLFFLNLAFVLVMALYGDKIRTWAQDWLGISALHQQLDEVTGRTRVIREEPGQSYVREPVYLGQPLTLVIVLARTQVGAACRLRQFIPLFTDDYGVTMAGEAMPPLRQIGTDFERLEIEIVPPRRLGLGHALLRLQLEYECGDRTVYEMTSPVGFAVLRPEDDAP
ncbi:hypothetical protein [Rubellimicrobium sp. CFH 75288]|uniref:hypothetical protein n=1 Tax=Rubellimicrobium sp. CFH 75288 TaxID=2697034 RepID=UPI0014124DE6|nr:hypothetical protein [Rubellimicrobium sp. CFH 75288]NAZ37133.1 hypothetical protein [Rubellimicrobium sp. CFH 75288]